MRAEISKTVYDEAFSKVKENYENVIKKQDDAYERTLRKLEDALVSEREIYARQREDVLELKRRLDFVEANTIESRLNRRNAQNVSPSFEV